MSRRTMGTGRTSGASSGRLTALLLVAALVATACGGEDEGTDPEDVAEGTTETPEVEEPEDDAGAEEPDVEAEEPDAEASAEGGDFQVEDGVLQPMADGYPERDITLWCAFSPGHIDDQFNISVAEIARDYSPVPLSTDCSDIGPQLQYGMMSFLEGEPGSDEGYHMVATSWFGPTLRPWSIEGLEDEDIDSLGRVNSMLYAPNVFVAGLHTDYESLEDVVAAAESDPGGVPSVASTPGGGQHTTLLLWEDEAGIETRFLPSDGATAAKQLIVGEGADFGVTSYAVGLSDEVRILATTGPDTIDELPDVPSSTELGYDSIPSGAGGDRGYSTLPSVPEDHIAWFNELMGMVIEDERFAERWPGFNIRILEPEAVREQQQGILDAYLPFMDELGLLVRPPD